MMKTFAHVTFEPEGRRVRVPVGTSLLEAANLAGTPLESPCGGLGICGKCRVQIVQGETLPNPEEERLLTPEELAAGLRLACRREVQGDTVVMVPENSRSLVQQILQTGIQRETQFQPGVRKIHLPLPRPALTDQRADLDRLEAALAEALGEAVPPPAEVDLGLARDLAQRLRAARFDVTATVRAAGVGWRLLDVEPGDTTAACYGLALDIGTTTVVAYLHDLNTGRPRAVASAMNAQMAYGDDLISRIKHAREHPQGRDQLREAILEVVNGLIAEVATKAGIRAAQIYEMTVVGNTGMTHFFLGLDPGPLGESPYVPVVQRAFPVEAQSLGVRICPTGTVYVLPCIAGFVGADTVGMLLAHLWPPRDAPQMAVDIGTNGEVVVAHEGHIRACSAAAGPAFEGARISCGMRGAPGAISHVVLNERVEYATIGNLPARGLCGSGLLDAVAQMLDRGLIDPRGRLLASEDLAHVPDVFRERVRERDGGEREFVLAPAEESATQEALTLTQRDIRELQLAKGSISAAIRTLLKMAGVRPEDLSAVYLAGGFGNYLRRESAQRIGLLPPEIPTERIQGVGNAAGTGATLALLSLEERRRAQEIAKSIEHVELAVSLDYQQAFMETMLFPE